ncbi:MAG TPA: hypothetical protein VH951_09645 [Dehalococcoidia bacterium]|jgi:hypothetical protein
MSNDLPHRRALIIGALGPAIFTLGLIWTVLRLELSDPKLTLRAIAFAPPHQMLVVGTVVSLICIPVALAVARATPEELALPGFDAELHADPPSTDGGVVSRDGQRRRRSYQGLN